MLDESLRNIKLIGKTSLFLCTCLTVGGRKAMLSVCPFLRLSVPFSDSVPFARSRLSVSKAFSRGQHDIIFHACIQMLSAGEGHIASPRDTCLILVVYSIEIRRTASNFVVLSVNIFAKNNDTGKRRRTTTEVTKYSGGGKTTEPTEEYRYLLQTASGLFSVNFQS